MFDNKKLGAYIQYLRKSKGLTQSRLAEILGLSPQAVSNWERGESMPDIALLTQIARALGTTVDRMLSAAEDFHTEKPPPEEPKKERRDVNLGNLSEVIRDSVMGALSGLSEQFQPVMQTLKNGIEDVMGDIEDAIEEAEEAMAEARETSRNADRVIIHVKARQEKKDDSWSDIVVMAPFASEEALDQLVRGLDTAADWEKIITLAPFLSRNTIDWLVKNAIEEKEVNHKFLAKIAPFWEEDTIDKLIEKRMEE